MRTRNHLEGCRWQQTTEAECEYRATHFYCPHPEHGCTCPPETTLEDLLRMTIPVGPGCVVPEGTPMSPEFRVAVQKVSDEGVHVIVHANGHNSETLDFIVRGNSLRPL